MIPSTRKLPAALPARASLTLLGLVISLAACAAETKAPARPAPVNGAPATVSSTAPNAAAAGQVTTSSGLKLEMLRAGSGASPKAEDVVRVHYKGTLTNGQVFDSSYDRGQPASFPLNRVIKCWTEGVQLMKVGAKARLTCPAAIAYGSRGAPPVIPPDATLVFEVELLGIEGR